MLRCLRVLQLPDLDVGEMHTDDLCRLLGAMPSLRFLATKHRHPNCILRALRAVGPQALPELRVVRFWQRYSAFPDSNDLNQNVLMQFLKRFRTVRSVSPYMGTTTWPT